MPGLASGCEPVGYCCFRRLACWAARHFATPARIASPMATMTITPSTAFAPAFPILLAISAPKEVRKPDVHPDPADTGDQRAQHEHPEPHPEDPEQNAGIVTDATKL